MVLSLQALQDAGVALIGERLFVSLAIIIPHFLIYVICSTFYHVCFKYRLFDDKLVRCVAPPKLIIEKKGNMGVQY
jgi:hypothetical protein